MRPIWIIDNEGVGWCGVWGGLGCGVDTVGKGGAACYNAPEPDQAAHEGELAWMVELATGDAFPVGQVRWLGKFTALAPIDEHFRNVLLDVQIIVGDGGDLLAELRETLNGLADGPLAKSASASEMRGFAFRK
jgi:hypothetical protein